MTRGFRDLIYRPLLERRRRLLWIAVSLFALTASQSVFLLLIKGFTTVLFDVGPPDQQLSLAALLPQELAKFVGRGVDLSVSRAFLGWVVPLGLLVAGFARSFAHYVYQVHQQALAIELAGSYREKLFAVVLGQPYAAVRKKSAGEWMSIVMNDVLFLQSRFSEMMAGLIRGGATVIAGIACMFVIHWPTGLVLLLLAPFAARGMGKTGKRIAGFADAVQRELSKLSAALLDLRSRHDFIRAQGAEAQEQKRFAASSESYYRMIRRSIMVRSAFAPMVELAGFVVFAGFVLAVAHGVAAIGPDLMLQFFAALGLLLKPLREIGEQLARLEETRGALQRSIDLYENLQDKTALTHTDHTEEHHQATIPKEAAWSLTARAPLHIAQVSIAHDGVRAFSADDLLLPWGQAIAIVGPSGAGKSTLVKALAGLWEPEVFQASWPWAATALRTSMVSQDPFLFDDTLRANLMYGLPDDTSRSDAQLWDVLTRVNVATEVRALPDGLDTRMRAIGGNVSGGQLQRLTIARALLRERPILLLDEATSAIDERAERDITERLTDSCRKEGSSLVAVTHRLRFLDAFDMVWFVEGGRIALRGAHRELLRTERYARYCASSPSGS